MFPLRLVTVALAVSARAEKEEKMRVSSLSPSDDDDDVDDIEDMDELEVDVPEEDDALAGLAGLSDILGDVAGIEDSIAKLKELLAERGDIDDDLKVKLAELDSSLGSIGVNTKVTPGGDAAAAAEACVSLVSTQLAMKGEPGAALLESVAWDHAMGSSLAAAEAADEDADLDSLDDDDDDDDEAELAGTVSVDLTRQNAAGRLVYACLATISQEESGLVARGELSELPQAAVAAAKGDTVEVPRNFVQPARERAATFAGAIRQMASAADPRAAGAANGIEVPLVAQLFAGAALLAIFWVGGKLFAATRGKSGARARSARKQARAASKKAKKNK